MKDHIEHIGVARRSGRYPWGSGDDPSQRNKSFTSYVNDLKRKGMKEKDIATNLGMSIDEMRKKQSISRAETRARDAAMALRLKNKGLSNTAIGERMGRNESSVRDLLNPVLKERASETKNLAKIIKDSVDKKIYIDIGAGIENHLGVSRTRLKTAVAMFEEEGYRIHYLKEKQVATGKYTSIMILTPPHIDPKMAYHNKDKISMITEYASKDGGKTMLGLEPVRSISSDRIKVKYHEEGGSDKDGVIEIRKNVPDLSLGNSRYAQVRIGVDDTHFLKGMAMYADDIPKGYDIVFNTNKPKGTPKSEVIKKMKKNIDDEIDTDNPFGATIKPNGQSFYTDKNGKKQLSAINKVNEEGDWEKWQKALSSQVLSKQAPSLAKRQLGLTYDIKKQEYDEIMALTNPVIKKKLLTSFADDCDAAAVHLKAAKLPRQASHVILPITKLSEKEVYAPNYDNGERVVLIRYPHGGKFEIPELVVNNKNIHAKNILGDARDAIGINPKVAERLSGADFDGDTVLVIPNNTKIGIKTAPPLKGLTNFNPREMYKEYPGMPVLKATNLKMGEISNLITDMTIKGAKPDELARAVRHSMVVIDAEKHKLNYKQSYLDNGIANLKKTYQGGEKRGASTLISKASSEQRVLERKDRYLIDPKTGKKIYQNTNESYVDKKGKVQDRTTKSTKMGEVDDAFDLAGDTPIEAVYATHANKLKDLGNTARKASLSVPPHITSPSAKQTYANEVNSLKSKLNIALKNAPLERKAQILANSIIAMKKEEYPAMDKDDLKKVKWQALNTARLRVGAKKDDIDIEPKEWEAIQAGAVSQNTLIQIMNNTKTEKLKMLATPRTKPQLSSAKLQRAKNMADLGYSRADIAKAVGVSVSALLDSM